MKRVTFYGHEKNQTTIRLAQINLAVHGLRRRNPGRQRGDHLLQGPA